MGSTTDRRPAATYFGWLCLALLVISGCSADDNRVQLLEIQVSDLERAVDFYQGVFGWKASRPVSSYAVLDAKPVAIGLALRDTVGTGGPVIVIAAQDLEVVLALVVQNGGVVREPIGPSGEGRQFTFADPDGNRMVVWSARADASGG